MNNKSTLFLFVGAIVAGAAAVFLANKFITSRVSEHKAALDRQYTSIEVVVPNRNLKKGAVVDQTVLAIRKVPRAFIHDDTVLPGGVGAVIGNELIHNVNKGEPLLNAHLSKVRGQGFSSLIEEGQRALTFPVDVINSVNGMLRPGDHVDLLMTLKDSKEHKTLPLLLDVEVVATGAQVDQEFRAAEVTKRYQTITVLLSSEDATRVLYANQVAESVRN